ncbi:hypothetical protein PSHT_07421 [Puccinia striiformis]|uniref:Myb/SANT-like domain-containing protein n=2 Tax=Puccinia striiformis TaxID=27350 RepID=A0A2S4VXX0_9BASI|nr:hypothetical protein PSHT_07421 [Puccinia striiformis]
MVEYGNSSGKWGSGSDKMIGLESLMSLRSGSPGHRYLEGRIRVRQIGLDNYPIMYISMQPDINKGVLSCSTLYLERPPIKLHWQPTRRRTEACRDSTSVEEKVYENPGVNSGAIKLSQMGIHAWSDAHRARLLELILQQIDKNPGKKSRSSEPWALSEEGWATIRDQLNTEFDLDLNVSKISNQRTHIREKFWDYLELRKTGFSWDDKKSILVADQRTWKQLREDTNPHRSNLVRLRDKPFPIYDLAYRVFEGTKVSATCDHRNSEIDTPSTEDSKPEVRPRKEERTLAKQDGSINFKKRSFLSIYDDDDDSDIEILEESSCSTAPAKRLREREPNHTARSTTPLEEPPQKRKSPPIVAKDTKALPDKGRPVDCLTSRQDSTTGSHPEAGPPATVTKTIEKATCPNGKEKSLPSETSNARSRTGERPARSTTPLEDPPTSRAREEEAVDVGMEKAVQSTSLTDGATGVEKKSSSPLEHKTSSIHASREDEQVDSFKHILQHPIDTRAEAIKSLEDLFSQDIKGQNFIKLVSVLENSEKASFFSILVHNSTKDVCKMWLYQEAGI